MKRWLKALKRQDWECTMWPDVVLACCIAHDYGCAEAWYLKDEKKRKKHDLALKKCANKKLPFLGNIMYYGIRSYLNTRKLLTGKDKY